MQDPYNSTNAKSKHAYAGMAPNKIKFGKGATLYDMAGAAFLDCGMALGSVSLGYAHEEVDTFVIESLRAGVNFSRPSCLEETLNNTLQSDLGPGKIARFSKSSSMVLAVIPRICRFLTGRDYIAYPSNGYYLGNTDWYLSKGANDGGITEEAKRYTLNFTQGSLESLLHLFETYRGKIACLIMEPFRDKVYPKSYYDKLRNMCRQEGVLLVLDETISGYRYHFPLAQSSMGLEADFTIIGKAFANGYAIAALVAEKNLMETIETACLKGEVFDFSTTHAGETVGLAAAIKTLEIIKREKVIRRLKDWGEELMMRMDGALQQYNLHDRICLKGQPSYFQVSSPQGWLNEHTKSNLIRIFFERNILCRGIISPCLQHTKNHLQCIDEAFKAFCAHASGASKGFD